VHRDLLGAHALGEVGEHIVPRVGHTFFDQFAQQLQQPAIRLHGPLYGHVLAGADVGEVLDVLAWPKPSPVVVTWLFGVALLANGVARLVAAITEPDASSARRVMLGLLGVLSVLAGMWSLRSPLPTLAAVAVLVGTWWIASRVLTLLAAVTGSTVGSRVWGAALAVLSVAGGFLVLLQPRISLVALEVTVGLMLLVLGLVIVVDAVRARSATV
jgi:uncharacterized membrane protein HdeD (DUF308 family)